MVTWQILSKQAEKLSWRDRLALIWQLVRSLLGRSVQPVPTFWERLQQWRSTIDWDSWSDDDPWADVRDRNPGRNVTL
ncbi:hypothetical protein H6G51_13735 [Limnothrix sp. FACHB-708]|uniref:hypothetical protein n=1 Tax=unclassified Limnothrix TaxID=2632864 RepID=UPI0016892EF5|nr:MULTISPECIES: hypothetical protein [unclassified Limnothrix]MBD2554344.1 hypothetical protein [Limnothrix sp. FACHB-708]MBD2591484.1 hypothetical protein [Limnothrix sp. FACHB-406]